MLRTTAAAVSMIPAGWPRQRRSAAITQASALTPTVVATSTLTTNRAHGSPMLAVAENRFWTCDSTVGVITSRRALATAAGIARTRNSDHSRPNVSKVRPRTDPTSIRGPVNALTGATQAGYWGAGV